MDVAAIQAAFDQLHANNVVLVTQMLALQAAAAAPAPAAAAHWLTAAELAAIGAAAGAVTAAAGPPCQSPRSLQRPLLH